MEKDMIRKFKGHNCYAVKTVQVNGPRKWETGRWECAAHFEAGKGVIVRVFDPSGIHFAKLVRMPVVYEPTWDKKWDSRKVPKLVAIEAEAMLVRIEAKLVKGAV
jgi:hypothetical protein